MPYSFFIGRFWVSHLEGESIDALRARKKNNLPVVLTKEEVRRVITLIPGKYQLMAKLMYGGGLRLMECIRLRVKDLDFEMNELNVRDGKGAKDRLTLLPESTKPALQVWNLSGFFTSRTGQPAMEVSTFPTACIFYFLSVRYMAPISRTRV